MPWTFAHPAAVLPLRRLGPLRLDFAALVIGSMTPDAPYYVHAFAVSTVAHTFAGSFTVCVPIGCLLLFAWHRLRAPVIALLPQPYRAHCALPPPIEPKHRMRMLLIAAASLLIGAWTHCAWDGFTHRTGWAVAQLPWLRRRPWDGLDLPLYNLLQHAGTLIGVAALLVAYRRWRERQSQAPMRTLADRRRCAVWAGAATIAVAIAGAAQLSAGMQRITVFRFVVDATSLFAMLVVACALALHVGQRLSLAGQDPPSA